MLYTLVLNGSPRPGGDTDALCEAFARAAHGYAETVRAYGADVSPCLDCRFCRTQPGCRIHDGMDAIYERIERADVLVIASPVFFSQLSGPLLSLLSRLQCRYMDRRRARSSDGPNLGRGIDIGRRKMGVVLLAAGGAGAVEPAMAGAQSVLAALGIRCIGTALAAQTDLLPAARDETALAQARALGLLAREAQFAAGRPPAAP